MAGKKAKIKEEKTRETEVLLKNQLVRALADYDNLSKRVQKEREGYVTMANLRIVSQLLPVLDMLYSAQGHLSDQGLSIAILSLEEVLSNNGFVKIESKVGEEFNQEFHEAIEVVEDKSKKDGEITEVVLTGWKSKDGPLVRPAKVKVNKVH